MKSSTWLTLSIFITLLIAAFFCGQWYAHARVGVDYISRIMYDNLAWRYAVMSIAATKCLGGW